MGFIAKQCGVAGGGTPVLVAHNGIRFDFPKLLIAFERVGMQLPLECMFIDTYKLAQVSNQHSCDWPHSFKGLVYLNTLTVIVATLSSSNGFLQRECLVVRRADTRHRLA